MAHGLVGAALVLRVVAAAAVLVLHPGRGLAEAAFLSVVDMPETPPQWDGPHAMTGGDDVRQFAGDEAERAAREACASPGAFVVLDTFRWFRPSNIDDDLVDPDHPETAEVGHGDLVVAIARQTHAKVAPYQIDPVFNAFTLARDVKRLADDIDSGKLERPAAVISSIVLPVDLDEVNRRLPESDRVGPGDPGPDKARLLDALIGEGSAENPYRVVRDALARLHARRVPVFVAAGNTAPDRLVNMLALNDGVFAVGALEPGGGRAPYTSAPELVALWAPARFVVTETEGGLSLNRGGEVAFRGAAMSVQKALLAAAVGRDAASVVRKVPAEIAMLPKRTGPAMRLSVLRRFLSPGIYRTADLMAAYGYAPQSGNVARALEEGAYMHFPSDTVFDIDREGRLTFDPLGDGSPGQLAVNEATSFAAPNLCASGRSAAPVGDDFAAAR